MEKIKKNAAGIDIGAKKVFVAIEGQEVRNFYTFTEDFEKLRDYLFENDIKDCCNGSYRSLNCV